ncbi:MAG: primosomal protein N' [Candidatus Parcubacteria bacterium]|nr:primosomal protein N' [Candidatus Parcubacteria bacterium]
MNKIAQIIPAVRLKRSLNYFDYLIPEELAEQIKIGQIVEIPFRNQAVKGVVFKLQNNNDSAYELKTLTKIIDPLPYLAPWQLELIEFMSEYYFVSMAMVLKMILPEIPKRKSANNKEFNMDFLDPPKRQINSDVISQSSKSLLLSYTYLDSKISVYRQIIQENAAKNLQTVIIVPELINLEKIYQYLGDFKDISSVLLNDLAKNKFWQEWLRIKNNEAKIIIGTRSALFAPFKNLGAIIIDEEDNVNHKQEEPNPRYNAKTIALKIADLTGAKAIFCALTPSLNSLFKVTTKEWDYWDIDKDAAAPQITVIDRSEEFKKGNFSMFSEKLLQSLETNLSQNKKSFLFLNRKGSATLVNCKDCGFIAICPTCRLPLTYHKKTEELHCHHCSYKSPNLLICPKCKSPEIKLTGTGTEKAETELVKLFPKSKIKLLDFENQAMSDIMSADIIIGTQYAFEYIDWEQIQTIGVLNSDTLFYVPDYRSLEKTYNFLIKFRKYLTTTDKELVCQTFSPDNYIFQAFKANDLKLFYQKETRERKSLDYPPFTKLIKIIFQSIDFNAGQEEVDEIFKFLNSKTNDKIIINPPLLVHAQQVNIIVFISLNKCQFYR